MRNRFLILLLIFALVSGTVFVLVNASASQAAMTSEAPVVQTDGNSADAPTADKQTRGQREELPADIQALFAEGMTAEEFVQMAGYVPAALADIVTSDALMIIEFEQAPLAAYYAAEKANGRTPAPTALQSYEQSLKSAQTAVAPQIESLGATIISNYTAVYNGIQVLTPLNKLNELRALPGVKAIHRAPTHEPTLSASVPLIGAPDVWEDLGYAGEGITIAIIDTGIDYTHAVFGGSGDPADFASNDPDFIESFSFPTAKVIGGYDFAGTTYNADDTSPSYQPIPNPDPDPLDEGGHGTHVASIAAGNAAGDVSDGVAPAAKLVALKVFGASGSTSLVIDALEWATHNYMLFGWPQVINMSLGSNFGTDNVDDPSVAGTENAVAAGIVVVASAGNAGNNSYITGSPATADKAISVAASTSGFVTGPAINISGTTYITQTNIIYTPASFDNDTGHYITTTAAPLAYVGNLAGATNNQLCSTAGIAPDALDGQIALIQRGTCAFSDKVNNAASLGAVGTIIYNNTAGAFGGIGVPVLIPAAFIQMQDGMNLVPADGEIVVVNGKEDVVTVPDPYTPADFIASFSSRGPRGYDSALKPEITAPGVGIFAADMGSGGGGTSLSGTSMAAPHVAGVAALMVQANPDWTPEQIKAAMMNTAVPLADNTPIPRTGSGRVDAYRAVDTDVFAIGNDDLVSLSWGVPMSRNDAVTRVSNVTLYNEGDSEVTYLTDWMFQAGSRTVGAALTVEPGEVTLAAGESAVVTVTLSLDMTQIPVLFGVVEEYYGWVVFSPAPVYQIYLPVIAKDGADVPSAAQAGAVAAAAGDLVVPFYFQPRPYSQLEEIAASSVITDPVNDVATFDITHRGPITSSLWAFPALVWNDTPDPAMAGPGDVRLFGLDYAGADPTYGDIVAIGIDAWNYWHVPQPDFAEFDLYIDADQDGTWDYVNFNWNNGARTGAGNNNVWVVAQVDLATNLVYLASPYAIYTDYNASYMEWYLPAAWQDLGPTNSTFDYQLYGFDEGGVSMNPAGQFDYANSPFAWDLSNDPGPANLTAVMTVSVDSQTGYWYSEPLGVMIVDYNGDPRNVNGGQAYFEPITVGSLDVFDLTILHTNDFHARVDQYNRNGARCKPADITAGNCIAGAPRVAAAVNDIRANTDNVVVVDAGDQFQGTLFYNLFKGDVLTMTMNYIGYDAMAVGNHEFDNGPATLASFISGSDFPVLSANIDASADPDLQGLILPYTVVVRGGQEIGIIGLTTPDTTNISSPGPNITFTAPITTLQATVDTLTGMGIDKIIALTHMGYDVDLDLAAAVSGVDVIVGGHSHSFLYSPALPVSFGPPSIGPLTPVGEYPSVVESPAGEPVLVVTAYQWGTFLGNLDVLFGPDGLVHYYQGNPIYLGTAVTPDPVLDGMLEPFRDAVADLIATQVGTTTVDLPILVSGVQICRIGECLMGNLVADAMLWKANQAEPGANYQIAFQNGGGLRAPILAGPVSMGDVLETLPFGNAIATFELQGVYVKAALENGARLYPAANGGFTQVSGLRYEINPALPAQARVVNVEVWNGLSWDPLDEDAMYKVVTNDFMRRGGDNYLMFRDNAVNPYDFGPALDEALADYFLAFSPVTPMIEGRIIFTP
ncbi:MAG: S8 family serine peptidase [Chloroflexi bacterium]|nr:S8 family serine peptidase [Chloroflexota bacterium]